jgi:hemerythrin-like metal-binding protein
MADFFPWLSSFETGITVVDVQHRKLVGMLNELFDAINRGEGDAVVGGILDGMLDYTLTHFATEEELFAKYGYPESEEHIQEHNFLRQQVRTLCQKPRTGQNQFALQVAGLLKEWLRIHILRTDKKFAPFLIAKGVK